MLELLFGIAFLVVMLLCVSDDDNPSPFWALLWLGVFGFGTLMVAFGALTMWGVMLTWVITHPANLIYGVLVYLFGAVTWASIKWIFFNRTRRRSYEANRSKWEAEFLAQKIDGYQESTFQRFVASRYDVPPDLTRNKYRLSAWMAWWPFNVVTTVFNLKKLFDLLYRWMSNFWGQLQHMVFHDVDFTTPKPPVIVAMVNANSSFTIAKEVGVASSS